MANTPDGRRVFVPQAVNARDHHGQELNLNPLADLITEVCEIFSIGETLVCIKDGALVRVDLLTLRGLIAQHITIRQLAKNSDGTWRCEYPRLELGNKALRTLLSAGKREEGSLLARLQPIHDPASSEARRPQKIYGAA